MSPLSARVRVVLLVIVFAALSAFAFWRVGSLHVAEQGQNIHPAFAHPPTAIATPPPGTAPDAWSTDVLVIAEHDGIAYLLLGIFLVAALVNYAAPSDIRRLRTSVLTFFGYALSIPIAAALLSSESLTWYGHVRLIGLMLEGVSIVNTLAIFLLDVALRLFRVNVPKILADVILAAAYVAVGMVLLTRAGLNVTGVVATSAVITAVIGLSLQDTLGNIMAGLVIEMEDAVNAGDWVKVGDVVGKVKEIRWRWIALETRNWDTVIIPNSILMKNQVLVLGRRTDQPVQHRQWVWFNVELSVAPSLVIETVEAALRASPIERVASTPPPNCILMEFKEGMNVFAVRYWLTDLAVDDPTDSAVRERIYFSLARAGVALACPAHHISMAEEDEMTRAAREKEELRRRVDVLSRVELFKPLEREELEVLAPRLRHAPFAKGEVMTRQGAQAHWLYLILSGRASVHVAKDGHERLLGELGPGEVFGEMALLTGEARSATVVAATAVECWRLEREGFESVIKRRPEIARELAEILAVRKAGLEAAKSDMEKDKSQVGIGQVKADLLLKISAFFGLGPIDELEDSAGARR
jgi:small-conductance mechanosensitive channel